jgi:enoyl-CoA hydratase/carnithine racemase
MGEKCYYKVDERGIALMEVNNPPMNALSTAVLNDIREAVTSAIEDKSVRVIVFTGAGRAFIAGADIKELKDLNTTTAGSSYLVNGKEICNLIENANKPFIAAINGFCLGGGLEFALACHIRLADETAQLGFPEIKLGVIPGYAGTQRTPRTIGKGRAYELILSGNFVDGKEAVTYGLANRSTPKGEVINEAKKLAQDIAARSRMAVMAGLKAIREGFEMEFDESQRLEGELFGGLCETEDKNEGMSAFLEKRDANFKDK